MLKVLWVLDIIFHLASSNMRDKFVILAVRWKVNSEVRASYVTTDGQSASLSWSKASIWGLRPDLYYMCDSYGLVLVERPL
jgi:hypothetical protein